MSSRKRIVVADAGVLINLIHVNALQLFGRLAGFEFVVIEHVVQEIIRPDQAAALAHAMQQGWIRRESLDRPASKHAGVQTDNYFGGLSKDLTCSNRGGKSILTVSQTTSHATSK
jgi:hypothetical protein